MTKNMPIRARIIVKGRVQKAGYRDFVDETAFKLGLKGYAKNLKDGTVEIVCECERSVIEEFLRHIRIEQYPIRVEELVVEYSESTGEFPDFDIVRDEDLTEAIYERMDSAVRYMREMRAEIVAKQVSGNTAIVDMDKHMGEHFEHLDGKYDNFGNTLEVVSRTLEEVARDIHKLADKPEQEAQ